MSKFIQQTTGLHTIVNEETGQILKQDKITKLIKVKSKEQFFTAYSKLVMSFADLDFAEAKVLVWCSWKAEMNTSQVTMVKHHKEELAKAMNLTVRTVDNALIKLVKKGYLHRIATSVFMIDPEMSWRGNPSEQPKQVQVFLTYKIGD